MLANQNVTGQAFNLDEEVNNWSEELKAKPSLTESDIEEIKGHLYDSYEDLLKKGLNKREAFLLARFRIGENFELDEVYKEANQPVIQMRRSLYILAGVLVYFMAYHFILFTSKLLIIVFLKSGIGDYEAVDWISRYLITWYFIFLVLLVSIYFLETKTVTFLKKVKLVPKQTFMLLIFTILIAIFDYAVYPFVKNMLRHNPELGSKIIHFYIYFDFSFPLLMSLGFIFIYSKYYRKTKF